MNRETRSDKLVPKLALAAMSSEGYKPRLFVRAGWDFVDNQPTNDSTLAQANEVLLCNYKSK